MASDLGNLPLPQGPSTPRRSGRKRAFKESQNNTYAAAATTPSSANRRQVRAAIASGNTPVIDLTRGASSPVAQPTSRKRTKTAAGSPSIAKEERRRRVFRKHPPQSYLQKLDRARTQRYGLLSVLI